MLQLSLDGRRLYSSWDNQFYTKIAETGSSLTMADCDLDKGGLKMSDKFYIDFGKEPDGPVMASRLHIK